MIPASSATSNYPSIGDESSKSTESTTDENPCSRTQPKNISSREADIWMVRALDSNFKPNLKRSPVIEQLEQKRKEKYESIIKEMEEDFKSVVEDGKNSLRLLAETCQGELEINYNSLIKLDSSVNENDAVNREKILCKNFIIQCFLSLESLKEKRKLLIDEFEEEAKNEMSKQLNEIKKIVAESHIKMNKIGLLQPYQLQTLFENRVMEIQKVIMSNYRTYAEVKLHLQLIGDKLANNVKSKFYMEYDVAGSSAKGTSEARLASPFTTLVLMNDTQKLAFSWIEEICSTLAKDFLQLTHTFSFIKSGGGTDTSGGSQSLSCTRISNTIREILLNMDECVKRVTVNYSSAIKNLRNGYLNDLKALNARFPEISSSCKSKYIKELGQVEMDRLFRSYIEEEGILQAQWKSVAEEIRSSLLDTLSICGNASEVRDRHMMRSDQAKDLLSDLLNRFSGTKTNGEQEIELKINKAVDTLRQGSTEENLDKSYSEIVELLDSLKAMYEKNYAKVVRVLEEYRHISQTEVELFINELQAFLNKHPRNTIVDIYKIVPPRAGDNLQLDSESDKSVNSKEMRMVYLHLTGVSNWTLGLWEGMNTLKNKASVSSKNDANKWIADEANSLAVNVNWKLQMNSMRYQRIKTEIKDVRLVELQTHKERLKSHTNAVENVLHELLDEINEMKSTQDKIVSEMKSKITDNIQKLNECTVSVFAKNVVQEIGEIQKATETELNQLHSECNANFQHKIKWLRQSNVAFLKSVKMFSEGGNYSWEEARVVSTEVQQIASLIEKSEGNMMKLLEKEIPDEFISYSVDSESLKKVEKKLILDQRMEREILILHHKLRSATTEMKQDTKVFNEAVELLMDESDEETIIDLLTALVQKMSIRERNLMFPEATEILELNNYNEEIIKTQPENTAKTKPIKGEVKEKGGGNKKKRADKKSPKSAPKAISYKDYRPQLFKYTNPDELKVEENNFLSITKVAILRKFELFQELSKEMAEIDLSRGQAPEMVTLNYEKNVEKYLKELQNYNLQCEEVWLIQIIEFLHKIVLLKLQCNEFIESDIEDTNEYLLLQLDKLLEKYKSDKKSLQDNAELERTQIVTKLKPIVGAPANKKFLVAFNKLAGETNCNIVRSYVSRLNKFKDALSTELKEYKEESNQKGKFYKELQNICYNPNMVKNLMNNLLKLKAPNVQEIPVDEDENNDRVSTSSKQSNQSEANKNRKTEELLLFIVHLVSQVQEKMIQLGANKDDMIIANSASALGVVSLGLDLQPFPYQDVMREAEEKYCIKLFDMAEQAVEENEVVLEEAKVWVRNWSVNVQKVRKIYIHE